MSYSFPCTPCGFDHAGECVVLVCGCKGRCKGHVDQSPPTPSNSRPPSDPDYVTSSINGYTVTVQVGSRWRLEHQYPGDPKWYGGQGWGKGYEVMAIVANRLGGCAIQMREWQSPQHPIYTCAIEWWDPNGNGSGDGGRNRFVAWT